MSVRVNECWGDRELVKEAAETVDGGGVPAGRIEQKCWSVSVILFQFFFLFKSHGGVNGLPPGHTLPQQI